MPQYSLLCRMMGEKGNGSISNKKKFVLMFFLYCFFLWFVFCNFISILCLVQMYRFIIRVCHNSKAACSVHFARFRSKTRQR